MAGKIEEDYAKTSVEQAKECLRDGDYVKASSLLGRAERLRPNLQGLSELVAITDVCHAATWRCSCRMQVSKPKTPDWYRILKVDETADNGTIKKRYRQLALLLHPDKNKNFKAEEAFKLVSEAYACLADRNRRKLFGVERTRTFCARCYASSSMNKQEKQQETTECNREKQENKSEQEMLQEFRDRARARVNKLTEDIQSRRSQWTSDLETVREKYQKRERKGTWWEDVLERRPIRESDVFQPSTNQAGSRYQVVPDSHLMNLLSSRRNLQREKFVASQSLDGFLSKLKSDPGDTRSGSSRQNRDVNSRSRKDSQELETSELRRKFQEQQSRRSMEASVTSRFFTKRVSSASEMLPARKLFKEDVAVEKKSSDETGLRCQTYPVFEEPVRQSETEARCSGSSRSRTSGAFLDENCEPRCSGSARSRTSGTILDENCEPATISRDEDQEQEVVVIHTPPVQRSLWNQDNVVGLDENLSSSTRRENAETVWTGGFCCSKTTMLKEQRQKSEELLKTLERLREEAKCVAETLDKLKRATDF